MITYTYNIELVFFSFTVLSLAASAGLTPGQDGNHTLGQRGSPVTLNLQRSLVPPRAKSPALAQTLASHAPRVDPKSRRNANPEVVPRRNPTVRSLEAARAHTQRVETKNTPQNLHSTRTMSSPSPRPSALCPAPGLALDPGVPLSVTMC